LTAPAPVREAREGEAVAEVTVCVPAYRAAEFLHHTLVAVQRQSFPRFVVEVGVEAEEGDETERACAPFAGDPRFRVRRNAGTLGWDRNVASLLARVATPFFAILPHDDVWHPRYLEALMARLRPRPDAMTAYADMYLFGRAQGSERSRLPDAGLGPRLLAYFLQGAEAHAWRGLTRAGAAMPPFPSNDFGGFAIECEWGLGLLREGVALRLPEPLYFKRVRCLDTPSVSAGWTTRLPKADLELALEHHRQQMLAGIPFASLDRAHAQAIELAAEAAMLRRWMHFGMYFGDGPFGLRPEQVDRAGRLLAAAGESVVPGAREITAMTLLALARHHRVAGDAPESERLALAATSAATEHWEAYVHLAWLQLDRGEPQEALRLAFAAAAIEPTDWTVRTLVDACDRRLAGDYAEGADAGGSPPIG
jgi:hypothetical protein